MDIETDRMNPNTEDPLWLHMLYIIIVIVLTLLVLVSVIDVWRRWREKQVNKSQLQMMEIT